MKKVEIFIRSIVDTCGYIGMYCAMLTYKDNKKIIYGEVESYKSLKRQRSIRNRGILAAMCGSLKSLKEPCKLVFYCEQDINEIMLYVDNIDLIEEFYKMVKNNHHFVDSFNIGQENQNLLHEHIIKSNIPKVNDKEDNEDKKHYIYYIYDCVYKKYYVGKSMNINDRWYEHKRFGARGYENNTYHIVKNGLYVSMKMNGINNFIFRVVESCKDDNEAVIRERFWIKKLDSIKNGYNSIYSFSEVVSRDNRMNDNQIIESNYKNKIHPEILEYYNKYIKPLNKNIRKSIKSIDYCKLRNTEWVVFKITSKITKQYYINCRNKVNVEDIQKSMIYKMKEEKVKKDTLAYFLQQHDSIDDLYIEILEYIDGEIDRFKVIYKWCIKYNPEFIATSFLRELYINEGNVVI